MKIKILDIISDYGSELQDSFCETCEFLDTWDITRVELEDVRTKETGVAEFNNEFDDTVTSWTFQDWIKFNDWLNATEIETYETIELTFLNASKWYSDNIKKGD